MKYTLVGNEITNLEANQLVQSMSAEAPGKEYEQTIAQLRDEIQVGPLFFFKFFTF